MGLFPQRKSQGRFQGVPQPKDSDAAVTAVINAITEALENGEKVSLVGFGTFEVKERAERMGHNPQTGEPMPIAASKAPVFKAGTALKAAVNK